MKEAAAEWTRPRWTAVVGAGMAVHLLAAWIFSRPGLVPSLETVPTAPGTGWIAGRPDPLAGLFVPPTRFALPAGSAFSAEASRALPRVAYEVSPPRSGPSFLGAGTDGARLGSVPRGPEPGPASTPSLPPAEVVAPASRIAATRGWLELHAPSQMGKPVQTPEVPPWIGAESPQATRVEFAVNPDGSVVTVRATLSSGSREADAVALSAVRGLRFPSRSRRPGLVSLEPDGLVWGVATLHPVASTATNPPAVLPAPTTPGTR